MSTTLSALEEVVDRHGRDALADPLTLTAALRSLTVPPPEDDVSALAAAAGAGATGSIRSALSEGSTPEQALDAVAPRGSDARRRWAAAHLGAALGLLPRSLAADPAPTGDVPAPAVLPGTAGDHEAGTAGDHEAASADDAGAGAGTAGAAGWGAAGATGSGAASSGAADSGAPGPGAAASGAPGPGAAGAPGSGAAEPSAAAAGSSNRRRAVLVGGALVVLLAGVVGAGLLTGRDGQAPASADDAAATAPPGAAPTGGATPAAGPPLTAGGDGTDPRAAFTDPVLRATAEPYLRLPNTTCEREAEPAIVLREQVTCKIGDTGGAGIFTRYFDPSSVTSLRQFMGTDETAVPGTRRTLRWQYVAGRPGVRAGIPAGVDREGAGTRIRWTGLANRVPLLYFDEDATGVAVQLSLLTGGDAEQLRRLWADPTG